MKLKDYDVDDESSESGWKGKRKRINGFRPTPSHELIVTESENRSQSLPLTSRNKCALMVQWGAHSVFH